MRDTIENTIEGLFERLFRSGSDDIAADLDGALAEAGLTDTAVTGAQLQAGLRTACNTAAVPAQLQERLGVAQVQVAGTAVAPAAPVLLAPPAEPTYPEIREYVHNVYTTQNQYYSDDDVTVIHDNSTTSNVDNSIDIDVDVEGGAAPHYDEYGSLVPLVHIDIDQDNDTQTNSGDGAVVAGGDVSNVNTGERGVVNDADDLAIDFGGGRPGVPFGTSGGVIRDPGFPPFGTGAGGDDTIINTGDNSSQVGDDNFGNVESGAGDLNDVDAYNSTVAVDESAAASNEELEFELGRPGAAFSNGPDGFEAPGYEETSYGPLDVEVTSVVAEVPAATAAIDELDA